MTRINPVDPSQAQGKTRELLEAVKKQMGTVPNIFKGFAQSPAALEFYLSQNQALAGGVLDPKLREQIALTMAGLNQCDYCAAAHTFLGKKAGVSAVELTDNLRGRSADEKTGAVTIPQSAFVAVLKASSFVRCDTILSSADLRRL